MRYKRNQVEKAISRVFETGSAKPSLGLRTRLKRLLETDRGLGRSKRSADPKCANFAFYSMEGPGRGGEVWFSAYEVFALLIGLRLMSSSLCRKAKQAILPWLMLTRCSWPSIRGPETRLTQTQLQYAGAKGS